MRRTLTVAAAVAMAAALTVTVAVADDVFPDVPATFQSGDDNPHHDNVSKAHGWGVFEGYDDGTFGPSDPIRRDQAASAIVRYDERVQAQIADIGIADVEADGPYPGQTQLADIGDPGTQGENSTDTWPANSELHEAWVACADGKVALGGGYAVQGGDDDASNADADIAVVTNAPAGDAIDGDPAGSVLPDRWVVRGFNNGDATVTVRPFVVCASVNG